MEGGEEYNWHGLRGNAEWRAPRVAVVCDLPVRPDQRNKTRADEMMDHEEVLEAKIALLAEMVRESGGGCVVYSGAGLSRAAGIADYASRAKESLGGGSKKLASPLDAQPTAAHCVIAQLVKARLVSQVVNQNHDGLAQKAGVPEYDDAGRIVVNEIHGAWFDPSNCVVQFGESLRGDLFAELLETERNAAMCLCVGTSLSGMNADRVVESCARRFADNGQGGGSVIVNLQRTPLDDLAALRLWAPADTVFSRLAARLSLPVEPVPLPRPITCTLVPYDANGERTDNGQLMLLDVSEGQKVRVGQASDPNKKNCRAGRIDEVRADGTVYMTLMGAAGKLARQAALGHWWIGGQAKNGRPPLLPIRNLNPVFVGPQDALAQLLFESTPRGDERNWDWSLKVLPGPALPVASVVYQLHPTFNPARVEVSAAPFALQRSGWGEFVVEVRIVFADDSHATLPFELRLETQQCRCSVPVQLKHRVL